MPYRKRMFMLLISLLLLTACTKQTIPTKGLSTPQGSSEPPAPTSSTIQPINTLTGNKSAASTESATYRAELSIETSNLNELQEKLIRLIESSEGFIVSSSVDNTGSRTQGTFIIRVPHSKFASTLNDIRALASKTLSIKIEGLESANQYREMQSQLSGKKLLESRLITFMDKANTTTDLIQISKDLTTVQTEISQLEGKLTKLDSSLNQSIIYVSLYERKLYSNKLNIVGKSAQLFIDMIEQVKSFVGIFVILVVGLSPIWLTFIVFILVVRFLLSRSKNKQQRSKP